MPSKVRAFTCKVCDKIAVKFGQKSKKLDQIGPTFKIVANFRPKTKMLSPKPKFPSLLTANPKFGIILPKFNISIKFALNPNFQPISGQEPKYWPRTKISVEFCHKSNFWVYFRPKTNFQANSP